MDSPDKFQPMREDRKKTNKSLLDERQRTDEALKVTHNALPRQTDQSIKADRSVSDQEMEVIGTAGNTKKKVSKTIQIERFQSDIALEVERKEREWLETIFLGLERRKTDDDLAAERDQTDAAYDKVSLSLEIEKIAHSVTRKALLSRDEILAIVSHDLRNPIGTVLSCSTLLLDHHAVPQMSPDTERWVRIIKRNAESALRLIGNLMDMESLETGKFELEVCDANIRELAQQLVENFCNEARLRHIDLNNRIGDGPLWVRCDSERILQVLSNLVGNALKFTPKGGSITVATRQNDDGSIQVSISDTGPGIPKDMRSIIFERFAQLANEGQAGLGLGLYISRKIIEAHGGRLEVDTNQGGGSCFTFTLPGMQNLAPVAT